MRTAASAVTKRARKVVFDVRAGKGDTWASQRRNDDASTLSGEGVKGKGGKAECSVCTGAHDGSLPDAVIAHERTGTRGPFLVTFAWNLKGCPTKLLSQTPGKQKK